MAIKDESYTIVKRPAFVVDSKRWVRNEFNGEIVVNSKNSKLLVDYPGGIGVAYFFPKSNINMDYLIENENTGGKYILWDVKVKDKIAKRAAFAYCEVPDDRTELTDYISFKWREMDRWFEEEEEIFGHPRDPFHRADAIQSSRHIKIELEGKTLAETNRPILLFETHLPTRYYIRKEDVKMDLLIPTEKTSICPYKGKASYWTVQIDGQSYANYVWGYEYTWPEMPKIKGMVCFYNEKVDVYIDGVLEERPKTKFI